MQEAQKSSTQLVFFVVYRSQWRPTVESTEHTPRQSLIYCWWFAFSATHIQMTLSLDESDRKWHARSTENKCVNKTKTTHTHTTLSLSWAIYRWLVFSFSILNVFPALFFCCSIVRSAAQYLLQLTLRMNWKMGIGMFTPDCTKRTKMCVWDFSCGLLI